MIPSLRPIVRVVLVLATLAAAASPGAAQSLTHGSVEGVVRDQAGAPLGGASVLLHDLSTGTDRALLTGPDGGFQYILLLPGGYELLVERFGYRPLRIRGVPVRPAQRLGLPVVLAATEDAAARTDTVRYAGPGLAHAGAGVRQHFEELELAGLPDEQRDLTWLARLSSVGSAGFELEGLPSRLQHVVVDGLPVMRMRHPRSRDGNPGVAPIAVGRFARAELVLNAIDVEWPGGSGALLSGYTRRGTPELRSEGFGSLAVQGPSGGAEPGFRGGALVSGPLVRDTASFVFGVEAWRQEVAVPSASDAPSLPVRAAAIAADSYGVSLPAADAPEGAEAASGFLRLDWQLARDHALTLHSSFSLAPRAQETVGRLALPLRGGWSEGRHASFGVDFTSRLSARLAQQIRVGGDFGAKEYGLNVLGGSPVPGQSSARTRILGDGGPFGIDAGLSGRFQQSGLRASETLYLTSGAHLLKFGLAASLASYDFDDGSSRTGEFLFSGIDDFAQGRGVFVQTMGSASEAEFSVPQLAVFLQDSWRAAPGLDLTGGIRVEAEALPSADVTPDPLWSERTGLDGPGVPPTRLGFSPRLGFEWDLQQRGRWLVSGAAGLFAGSADPALLSEVLTFDSGVEVRRGAGTLRGWPQGPDSSAAPVVGPRLSLLAPGYSAPRTGRVNLGLSHFVTPRTALHLSVGYRRTDFLPRRRDLNLLPTPSSRDQHGRPVHGELRLAGDLLLAASGSNRRFPDFDAVTTINFDGWSEHQSATVAAEHRGELVSLFGTYTASRARDNWLLGNGIGGGLPPFPQEVGVGAWEEGVSDLDVPHRAVLAAEVRPLRGTGAALALVYRYRSGSPFTPGFREGVDINGDGSSTNDPAFVDEAVPGMDRLLGEWPCLRPSAGSFAARNSCRGPGSHALDARLSYDLARRSGLSVAVVVDGINLSGSSITFPDAALYRVDGAAPLRLDDAAGTISVPLAVNENFGRLFRFSPGRVFRLGLRVSY